MVVPVYMVPPLFFTGPVARLDLTVTVLESHLGAAMQCMQGVQTQGW
jgi:hypothetical protein